MLLQYEAQVFHHYRIDNLSIVNFLKNVNNLARCLILASIMEHVPCMGKFFAYQYFILCKKSKLVVAISNVCKFSFSAMFLKKPEKGVPRAFSDEAKC